MMGSDQHTPGPWFVAGVRFRMNGGEWHGIHRYDEAKKQDENIAAVGYDPRTGAGWADAQLIASAPTMAARITELEAALSAATARVKAAEAEAARLREALEPFANACGELFNDWCPDETPAWWSDDEPSTLAVGDFRKARAALGGDHG